MTIPGPYIMPVRASGSLTTPSDGQYYSTGVNVSGSNPPSADVLSGYAQIATIGPTAGIAAANVQAGNQYEITYVGTTDWTAMGSVSNKVGRKFKATSAGAGTGVATLLSVITAAKWTEMAASALHEYYRWPLGGSNSSGAGSAVYTGGLIYASKINLIKALLVNNGGLRSYAYEYTFNNGTGAGDAGPWGGSGSGLYSALQPWGYTNFPTKYAPNTGIPADVAKGGKITAATINALIGAINSDAALCTCNCNYCTCNCNYCTCNCNYSCTCNCNYSDERVKTNIEYM